MDFRLAVVFCVHRLDCQNDYPQTRRHPDLIGTHHAALFRLDSWGLFSGRRMGKAAVWCRYLSNYILSVKNLLDNNGRLEVK